MDELIKNLNEVLAKSKDGFTCYWVGQAIAKLSAASPQVVADERAYVKNLELVIERLKDMRHLYPQSHVSDLAKEALVCARAALVSSQVQAQEPVAYRLTYKDFRHYSGATATGQDKLQFKPVDLTCGYFEGCDSLVVTPLYAAPAQHVAVPDSSREAFEKCLYSFGQRVAQDVYKDIHGTTMDVSADKTRHIVKGIMADIVGKGLIEDLISAAPAAQGDAKPDMFLQGVFASLCAIAPYSQHGDLHHDAIVCSVGKDKLYSAAKPVDVRCAGLDPNEYASIAAKVVKP